MLNSKMFSKINEFFSNFEVVNSLEDGANKYGGATKIENVVFSNYKKNDFINLNEDENNISVFIPSTINYNESIDNTEYVKKYMTFIRNRFKNENIVIKNAKGSYKEESGNITYENVSIIEVVKEKLSVDDIAFMVELADLVKNDMKQWCVSVGINNSLALV